MIPAIVFFLFVSIALLIIGILFITRISRRVQVIIDNVETTVEEIGFSQEYATIQEVDFSVDQDET